MNKVKLKIDGMHCTSCAFTIDMDLEDLDGVVDAKTHYAKSEVEIEFDPKRVETKELIEAIKKAGYTVVDV